MWLKDGYVGNRGMCGEEKFMIVSNVECRQFPVKSKRGGLRGGGGGVKF